MKNEIENYFLNCQHFGPSHLRFTNSIPTDNILTLREEMSIDLAILNVKAALHFLDTATRFSSAAFLGAHGATYVYFIEVTWFTLLECWCFMKRVKQT